MNNIIIFDMDGTILNTLDDLTNSLNYVLEKNSFMKRTPQEVRKFIGDGLRMLLKRALPAYVDETLIDNMLIELESFYSIHSLDCTKEYDGITELLLYLKNNNYKLALVSNKVDSEVSKLANSLFPNIFDSIIGQNKEMKRKPNPDSVLETIKRLNGSKDNTIYIGDTEVDYMTAINAGIDYILVSWGFRDEIFLKSLSNIVVNNVLELKEKIVSEFNYK